MSGGTRARHFLGQVTPTRKSPSPGDHGQFFLPLSLRESLNGIAYIGQASSSSDSSLSKTDIGCLLCVVGKALRPNCLGSPFNTTAWAKGFQERVRYIRQRFYSSKHEENRETSWEGHGDDDGNTRDADWEPLEPPNNTCHWYGNTWSYENGDAWTDKHSSKALASPAHRHLDWWSFSQENERADVERPVDEANRGNPPLDVLEGRTQRYTSSPDRRIPPSPAHGASHTQPNPEDPPQTAGGRYCAESGAASPLALPSP